MKCNICKILEFKSTREPIKVLGICLSYNQDKNIEENFLSRIRKMKTKLKLWLSRDLTLYGNSLLAESQLVYQSQLVYATYFQMQLLKLSRHNSSLSYGKTKKIK